MKKYFQINSIVLASLLAASLLISSAYAQEQLNMITYYPAPFGSYDRLRTVPRPTLSAAECTADTIGTFYVNDADNLIYYCGTVDLWTTLDSPWTKNNDNLYPKGTLLNPNLYVGIGTEAPASLLHIESDGDATLTISADADNNSSNENPRIQFSRVSDAVTGGIGFEGNPGQAFTDSLQDTMYIENAYNSAIQLATNGIARITILGNGNVGVGRIDPQMPLHVEGNINTSGDLYFQDNMRLSRLSAAQLGYFSDGLDVASFRLFSKDNTPLGAVQATKPETGGTSIGLLDGNGNWIMKAVTNADPFTEFKLDDVPSMRLNPDSLELNLDGTGMNELKVKRVGSGYYAVYAP